MNGLVNVEKGIFAVVIATLTYCFGGWDKILAALVTFIVLDYITGILSAWNNKELNSNTGRKGIIKKIMLLAVVAVANIIDNVLALSGTLRSITICFFITNEGISILENAAKLGVPIPERIIEKLEQLKNKESV